MPWRRHNFGDPLQSAFLRAEGTDGCELEDEEGPPEVIVVRYGKTDGRFTIVKVDAARDGSDERYAQVIHKYLDLMGRID